MLIWFLHHPLMSPLTWPRSLLSLGPPASHLHADDRVDEEQHDDEQSHIRQSLAGSRGSVRRASPACFAALPSLSSLGTPGSTRGRVDAPSSLSRQAQCLGSLRRPGRAPGQRAGCTHLEGLDECPQQGAHTLCPAQQLDQPHDPEQAEEGAGDAGALVWVLRGGSPRGQSGWHLREARGRQGGRAVCVRRADVHGGERPHITAHVTTPAGHQRRALLRLRLWACSAGRSAKPC